MQKTKQEQKLFTGERALFRAADMIVDHSVFENGESPLKEARNIDVRSSLFRWKYPIWYCRNVTVEDCVLFEMARAGVWYSDGVTFRDTVVEAPKNFRRCRGVTLENVQFPNAQETLWSCDGVRLDRVNVKGDYFAMNCSNIEADGLTLVGNYSFDGCRNVTVRNSRLVTKDAFWNCENVTVVDSFVSGEYTAWNSKNVTFINCTLESHQGLCYVENLKLRGCTMFNTSYAFEYSSVDAEVDSAIDSVFNPSSGRIRAAEIGELIMDPTRIDPSRTEIVCPKIRKTSDRGDPS